MRTRTRRRREPFPHIADGLGCSCGCAVLPDYRSLLTSTRTTAYGASGIGS